MASRPEIVILMHPLEARHPVGTGRMAHRCLSNSKLWVGSQFQEGSEFVSWVRHPEIQPFLLFPGKASRDLSVLSHFEKREFLDAARRPVVIILDATWDLAQKMLHHSPELQRMPRVSFAPEAKSRFLIRKQPRPECLSSIEAIHRVLSLLDDSQSYDGMLRVFDRMVQRQLEFAQKTPRIVQGIEQALAL